MKIIMDSIERETLMEPLYKKIDGNGRIYVDKHRVGEEILVSVLKATPDDKVKWLKVGR
jgi:hypothetical protein